MNKKKRSNKKSRMYIAFMGPPLAPLHAKCSCGKTVTFGTEEKKWPVEAKCSCGKSITLGKDKTGWYVEGAEEILIKGSEFEKPRSEVAQ